LVQLGVFLDDVARGGQERLVSTLDQIDDSGSEEILRSDTQLLRLEREMFGLGISEAHGQARHDPSLAPRLLATAPLWRRGRAVPRHLASRFANPPVAKRRSRDERDPLPGSRRQLDVCRVEATVQPDDPLRRKVFRE